MSQETIGGTPLPEVPQESVKILEKVGLTPKEVEGKSILGFGEGIAALGRIESVNFQQPDMEVFYATDTLGETADIGIIVDHARLQGFMNDADFQDLLAAIVGASQQEVRLVAPRTDSSDDSIEKLVEDVEMLLSYNYGLERTVEFRVGYDVEEMAKSQGATQGNSYLRISPLTPQEA